MAQVQMGAYLMDGTSNIHDAVGDVGERRPNVGRLNPQRTCMHVLNILHPTLPILDVI